MFEQPKPRRDLIMRDKFESVLKLAETTFDNNESARLLLSWDAEKENFVLHDLTYTHNTFNYFDNWNLCPLCYIIVSHVRLMKDQEVLKAVCQGWCSIIENITMPPCDTAVTLPVMPELIERTS